MTTRTRDLVFAAIALALAIVIAVTAFGYPFGSSYFPRTLAVFMGVMAAFFGVRILLNPAGDTSAAATINLAAVLTAFGSVAAYVLALKLVGFEGPTFLFLLLLMLWLGAVGWLKALILSAVFTAFLNVIFFGLLSVPRPDGLLF